MRRPRARINVEWVDLTTRDVTLLAVMIAIGLALVVSWSGGSSIFRFESPFWDLGLIPILSALAVAACRLGNGPPDRRRFRHGFVLFGLAAVAAYVASCSQTARWSLVSALLPYQTGLMLAPDVGASWTSLVFWNILVDTAVLASLPFVVATVGGVLFSARFTTRRIAVWVAIIALVVGTVVGVGRRVRRFDQLAAFHRRQIVGQMVIMRGADGRMSYVPSGRDRSGTRLTPHERKMDRWHEKMAQRYLHAARYPWLDVTLDPPPAE
jgi:hypothetical protein